MNNRKFLELILGGRSDNNVDFSDLCRLVAALGFSAYRQKGSHHIFAHPAIPEIINLQPRGHQAKPYQVKQVRSLILRYNLSLSEHAD